jgi:hypothetical protein
MKLGERIVQLEDKAEQQVISSCTAVQNILANIRGFVNTPNHFIPLNDCRVWASKAGYMGMVTGSALAQLSPDLGAVALEMEANDYLFFTRGDNDYLAAPLSNREVIALLQLDYSSQSMTLKSIERALLINGFDISTETIIAMLKSSLASKLAYVSNGNLALLISDGSYSIRQISSEENGRVTEYDERRKYVEQLEALVEKKQTQGKDFILRAEVLEFCPKNLTRVIVRTYNQQQAESPFLVYLRLGYIISRRDTRENQFRDAPDFVLRKSMNADYLYQSKYCHLGAELQSELEGYKFHFLTSAKGARYRKDIAGTRYTLVGLVTEQYVVPFLLPPGELRALQGRSGYGVDLDTVTQNLMLALRSRMRANLV